MRRDIIFLLLLFILFIGCRPDSIQTASGSTQVEIIHIGTADISATLFALPQSASVENSRIVLLAFFEAYNRHDWAGVLATFAETFAYGDCDFAARKMLVFETKEDLTVWLQTKFAEGDQFHVEEMIIAHAEGSPANDPRSTAVQVFRTNETLKELSQEKQSVFKIVLNQDGNRIQYLNTYGNVDCEAGR